MVCDSCEIAFTERDPDWYMVFLLRANEVGYVWTMTEVSREPLSAPQQLTGCCNTAGSSR